MQREPSAADRGHDERYPCINQALDKRKLELTRMLPLQLSKPVADSRDT